MSFDLSTGKLIKSISGMETGAVLLTEVHDGKIESLVRKTQKKS